MDARDIIFDWADNSNRDLLSLMNYLDTDILVGWFVDEGYIDELDGSDEETIMHHYELHC